MIDATNAVSVLVMAQGLVETMLADARHRKATCADLREAQYHQGRAGALRAGWSLLPPEPYERGEL